MGEKVKWEKSPKVFKDPDYLQYLHTIKRCLVCKAENVEVHHIKDWSIKGRDDRYVLPLCAEHHRGSELSPHGAPELFLERYPKGWQIATAKMLYKKYVELKEKSTQS